MADEKGGDSIVIKKIKKGGHGAHGGAWKVAYADFVTAMMAFFLVMWIVAMDQSTKEGIQKYFEDPIKYIYGSDSISTGLFQSQDGNQNVKNNKKGGDADGKKTGTLGQLHLVAEEMLTGMRQFKPDIEGFKAFPDHIQFAITAEEVFAPGSTLLLPEVEPILNVIANALKNLDVNIMIEAHSDDIQPEATDYPSNWELTAARAATVARYFVEGHSYEPTRISAMAAGDSRPIADNRTPAGRSRNRRVDFYLVPYKGDGSARMPPR